MFGKFQKQTHPTTQHLFAVCWLYIYIYSWTPGSGNCLQRLTFDQAEQSEATEDGFQRIREVTGLTDVMDIVHKLLGQKNTTTNKQKQKKQVCVLLLIYMEKVY